MDAISASGSKERYKWTAIVKGSFCLIGLEIVRIDVEPLSRGKKFQRRRFLGNRWINYTEAPEDATALNLPISLFPRREISSL
jgi:hypothetical protein